MSKKTEAAPEAIPGLEDLDAVDAGAVLAIDEHAGHGGSYVFDPLTRKRTPVEGERAKNPTE